MNENVVVSVIGLQDMEETQDNVELIAPGKYYLKNGKHYITYEETEEDTEENVKNIIKVYDKTVEVSRKGSVSTKLCFEEGITNQSIYSTPYGEMLLEIKTNAVQVEQTDQNFDIKVEYELFFNNMKATENKITIKAKSVKK